MSPLRRKPSEDKVNGLSLVAASIRDKMANRNKASKDLEFRKGSMYNERFTVSSLKNQLEEVLAEMDASERPVSGVIIRIVPEAIQYVGEVQKKLDCELTPTATFGKFILERKQVYI